jgi:hypothetical protein
LISRFIKINTDLSNFEDHLLYNKNDIKIYTDTSSDTIIEPSYTKTNRGIENYVHVRVKDGNKIPTNITYLNFDAMPLMQKVYFKKDG